MKQIVEILMPLFYNSSVLPEEEEEEEEKRDKS